MPRSADRVGNPVVFTFVDDLQRIKHWAFGIVGRE
jgi:hypothetical protein